MTIPEDFAAVRSGFKCAPGCLVHHVALDRIEAAYESLREGDLGEAREYGDRWRSKANELVAERDQLRETLSELWSIRGFAESVPQGTIERVRAALSGKEPE